MLSAYECGLYDEEPIFVSDEVILWGVSMSDVDDVLERCRKYYGVALTLEETQQPPLWKLLRLLDERGRLGDVHDGCYGKNRTCLCGEKGTA